MEFINDSIAWCKGEIFEGKLIVVFGLLSIVLALLFYKTGSTPNAKAMLYPLLVLGVLCVATGAVMLYNNPKRIETFKTEYAQNPKAFVQAEKERTENFMTWYKTGRYIMTVLGGIGILCFLFWATPIGRAAGITLILLMLTVFVIDHFSEERAIIYHQQIIRAVNASHN